MSLHAKFCVTRNELNAALIERDNEVDTAMTALLAGEHCLFIGPPGTAKSMLADAMVSWLHGTKFSVLLNRFTTPEEVFGPVSINGLKTDEFRRVTTNMLPEAQVAFMDEIFKASSAILNTTLKILNERVFQNGTTLVRCPLQFCIAASNEWPTEANELGALFDRFLFRKTVEPVSSDSGLARLLVDDVTPKLSTSLSVAELQQARAEASQVVLAKQTIDTMLQIRRQIASQGVLVGDRRWKKTAFALQCSAWLNGSNVVTNDDLEILKTIWSTPTSYDKVAEVVADIAKPSGLVVSQLFTEARQIQNEVNVQDLAGCATACKKLGEIVKKLTALRTPKADDAANRITDIVAQIKQSSFANLG